MNDGPRIGWGGYLALERDLWMVTEDFAKSSDPTTLGAEERMRQYLENRLVLAFSLGAEVGRRYAEASLPSPGAKP